MRNYSARSFSLVRFSVDHPKTVVATTLLLTLGFLAPFPRVKTDTNPKNMLPKTSDVRVWNDEVDRAFGLHEDMIVVGVVSEKGIANRETLGRIYRITDRIVKLRGVAAADVAAFSTITNVTEEGGTLKVAPLMPNAPGTNSDVEAFRSALDGNPLFKNRIISPDGKTTAIYVPLEQGANGKEIADRIRAIVRDEGGDAKISSPLHSSSPERSKGGDEEYHIAGDPVARDTFGAEMFKLMGLFSPIAGMIMFAAMIFMFRNLFFAAVMMMCAMISVIWSLGLLIGLGFPIHIMTSMSPVFLMAIATDSIHIFNEFYFRYRERKDKRTAILETMEVVSRPVRYTALATAVGFGVLMLMDIIPVRVFGFGVAFGTVVLRLLSFSLTPALLTFVNEKKLEAASRGEDIGLSRVSRLLRALGAVGVDRPKATLGVGLVLLAVAIVGTTKIVVNNNMVKWFSDKSEIRRADAVMNRSLGGTSLAYIVATGPQADSIKTPDAMRAIDGLQRRLEQLPSVGKTVSVVDYVKRIHRVLHEDRLEFDAVPNGQDVIGQYLFLFAMSAKPSDLNNVVDYPFQRANIWVQMKTWDAQAMRDVIRAVEDYKKANPTALEFKPAGPAYFNLVWNDKVLWDMLIGFIVAMVAVFVILALNFRSVKWALVGYMPLLATILLIYGAVGFMGKDFDMPISVLSCLSLGMSVDFAIHFISRFRQRLADAEAGGSDSPLATRVREALLWTAARPGKGILRNAILFASAFSVMVFAPLTPYVTVGAFIVTMMLLGATLTLIYVPALITLASGRLVRESAREGGIR